MVTILDILATSVMAAVSWQPAYMEGVQLFEGIVLLKARGAL
jgi:hypothetical protein